MNLAPGISINLRVILVNQSKYSCCRGISPSTAWQRRWRRWPQSVRCIACLRIQSTPIFPLKSIAWSTGSVLTWRGISWIIPNCRTTRSGVCFSTRWKHTSGTIAVHTALPTTHHDGRFSYSSSYDCHTTYNSPKTNMQHIRQLSFYFKVQQIYILFLNMLNKAFSYLVWQH